jgi:AcrR family transcriptional regulator
MPNNIEIDRRDQILDTAAEIFAEMEYYGASMRTIAKRANVSQSLIHYYYETKEQLFQAVFDRHAKAVTARRIELLSAFLADGPRRRDRGIEELVELLMRPWVEVTNSKHTAAREFARFIIRSAYDDDEWSRSLAVREFAQVTRLGVQALRKLIPEFSANDAYRAYFFTLSMFYMPSSAPGRITSLAGQKIDIVEPEALIRHGVRFAVAGIKAMRDVKTAEVAEPVEAAETA